MKRHANDRYPKAFAEEVSLALENSVGKFARENNLEFDRDDLHDQLDAAPWAGWRAVIETYVLDKFLPKLVDRLEREFDDGLFEGLNLIVGLKGQEVEFWDELDTRMGRRPLSDLYEVGPDLMDEFYEK